MPEPAANQNPPQSQLARLGIVTVDDAVRVYERQLQAIYAQRRIRLEPHTLMIAAGQLLFVAQREKGEQFAKEVAGKILEVVNSHTLRTHSHVVAGALGGVLAGAGIKVALERLIR